MIRIYFLILFFSLSCSTNNNVEKQESKIGVASRKDSLIKFLSSLPIIFRDSSCQIDTSKIDFDKFSNNIQLDSNVIEKCKKGMGYPSGYVNNIKVVVREINSGSALLTAGNIYLRTYCATPDEISLQDTIVIVVFPFILVGQNLVEEFLF